MPSLGSNARDGLDGGDDNKDGGITIPVEVVIA